MGTRRRTFLKLLGGGAAVGVAGGALDGFLVEPRWVRRAEVPVGVPGLSSGWRGARIAFLTDLHVGRLVDLDYVRKVVRMTNEAAPDIVLLGGDYVSRRDAITPELSEALSSLEGPHGRFAVLGNHDSWTDAAAVTDMLNAAGIALLQNAHTVLRRGDADLCIAGVDDLWTGQPDLSTALDGCPTEAPRLLLCHNPDYAEQMPHKPHVDLLLCGHTHGGQVNLPLIGRPRLPIRHKQYAAGLASGPACPVYTSVGLGETGIPVRFNCRPELTVLTLRRA